MLVACSNWGPFSIVVASDRKFCARSCGTNHYSNQVASNWSVGVDGDSECHKLCCSLASIFDRERESLLQHRRCHSRLGDSYRWILSRRSLSVLQLRRTRLVKNACFSRVHVGPTPHQSAGRCGELNPHYASLDLTLDLTKMKHA